MGFLWKHKLNRFYKRAQEFSRRLAQRVDIYVQTHLFMTGLDGFWAGFKLRNDQLRTLLNHSAKTNHFTMAMSSEDRPLQLVIDKEMWRQIIDIDGYDEQRSINIY